MKISFLILLCTTLCNPGHSQETEFIYYTCQDTAKLYSGPNDKTEIIDVLPYGQKVTPLETGKKHINTKKYPPGVNPNFVKIKYKNKTGFLASLFYLYRREKGAKLPDLFLNLSLKDGTTLQLKNNLCDVESYTNHELISHEKDIGFYLVKISGRDGFGMIFVSDQDGKQYDLLFEAIISPDRNNVLGISDTDWNAGIVIYNIKKGIATLVFKQTLEDSIAGPPHDGKWISNNEIEYFKDYRVKGIPSIIKNENGHWVEK